MNHFNPSYMRKISASQGWAIGPCLCIWADNKHSSCPLLSQKTNTKPSGALTRQRMGEASSVQLSWTSHICPLQLLYWVAEQRFSEMRSKYRGRTYRLLFNFTVHQHFEKLCPKSAILANISDRRQMNKHRAKGHEWLAQNPVSKCCFKKEYQVCVVSLC